jgi:TetR/AcrR family transcriptional regulator, tetracycline repressor protein
VKLARKTVVQTAIRLLDEVGLDGLTMRRLAQELGVQAPTLYWHFENKQELLDHMLVAMAGDELREPRAGQSWDEWLIERARIRRTWLLAHRDAARLAARTRPTADLMPEIENMLGTLRAVGFSPGESLGVIRAIGNYVTGSALAEEGSRDRPLPGDDAERPDLTGYPNIQDAAAELPDPAAIFEHGLQALVEGFRARLGR